ncbi:DNA polymerase IV [Histophilus somni]|uniref:DNA polymerase IV n=1 Tax=Histophilus somni TaxID=731 RepID=A0A9Q6Z1M9_HISSO|nr:DNA polymerase IV [Histophilus somni]ARU64838.1 DNA polymerase IV [Histophilus somni]ARU67634.1 DNA polymerase IV [Histophilus somni]ARU69515.1 DNA polymerase IV [Histophilus somni]ARU70456.1 DNA polymerase IV [Histophilus somni]ARU72330.1 DNA polymerase IV [Histophilus somni]
MMFRKIIHIDMDCFYASIEIRDKPELYDRPVAVGGLANQRGVLSTCNYVARQFGLHSAMPTSQALKLCPDLVLLAVNMPLYKQVSQQIQHIFLRYTDLIEPLSLDEAYLDVTDCQKCSGSATWIAEEIRQIITQETGLTASAGIAPLKFLAKIASDQNKPNGQFVIKPEEVATFIRQLPLKKIPGVGKVTTQRLQQMGLETCSDIQQFDYHVLIDRFGKIGHRIWQFSQGIDERPVQSHREPKSIGLERTLMKNILQVEQGIEVINSLYPLLLKRIKKTCPAIPLECFCKIGVKLKFYDFQITTLEKSAVKCSQENFVKLLTQIWQRHQNRSVRLVGLYVSIPTIIEQKQMSLW